MEQIVTREKRRFDELAMRKNARYAVLLDEVKLARKNDFMKQLTTALEGRTHYSTDAGLVEIPEAIQAVAMGLKASLDFLIEDEALVKIKAEESEIAAILDKELDVEFGVDLPVNTSDHPLTEAELAEKIEANEARQIAEAEKDSQGKDVIKGADPVTNDGENEKSDPESETKPPVPETKAEKKARQKAEKKAEYERKKEEKRAEKESEGK